MIGDSRYGFRWGPMWVQRVAQIAHRGRGDYRVLEITTNHHTLQVNVSPKGQSIRVFLDHKELK
jgi:hypothetical protein